MCKHHLHFYEDHYPAQQASDFLIAGLEAGDSGLLLLTQPHRQAVERCLRMRGVRYEDACVFVDSDEAVAQIRASGSFDLRRARELLTPFMRAAAGRGSQRMRAVGDLAPTLCVAGQVDDAIAFEALVHDLTLEYGGSTLCAYALPQTADGLDLRLLYRLSAEHNAIRVPGRLWMERFALPVRAGRGASA